MPLHTKLGVFLLVSMLSAFPASALQDLLLQKAAYGDPNGNTHVVCQDDATQSYELYIPASVPTTGPAPIMYGFDPGGSGKNTLLKLAAAASANGWILAVSNNSQNGPWDVIFAAQDAVLKDTEARLNLHPTLRFASGFSGGARASLALAFRYPAKICGVLLLGAGWPINTDLVTSTDRLNVYILIGTQDDNYSYDIPMTQGELCQNAIRTVVQTFNGGHVWPSESMVLAGAQWLNANADVNPNAGLSPVGCTPDSQVCQPPPLLSEYWYAYASDTVTGYVAYEAFGNCTRPIAHLRWWGLGSVYNSTAGYWLPSDPGPSTFRIRFYTRVNDRPGAVVFDRTLNVERTDLPHLYSLNYPLREYSVTLPVPVSLTMGYISIQQSSGSGGRLIWLRSSTGANNALQYYPDLNDYVELDDNLAISIDPEELDVQFAASSSWGGKPLTVAFDSHVTGHVAELSDWRWDFGDGTVLEGDYPLATHTYEEEGSYTVSLTVSTSLSSATRTQEDFVRVSQSLPGSGRVATLLQASLMLALGLLTLSRIRSSRS